MKKLVYEVAPNLKLLSPHPTLPGYDDFVASYLFCGEKKVLVDVGFKTAVPGLIAALDQAEVKPDEIDYIILTHIHMDHAGGIGQAAREMKNARVIAHQRAFKHLIDPTELWKASQETLGELALKYGAIEPVPENRIIIAKEAMELDLGKGLTLEIYLTPGHAPHHLCVFDRKERVLLAGDMAGVYMDGFLRPAAPPPFVFEDYVTSLDKVMALQPDKIAYSHFGCYDNAPERLRAAKKQIILWRKIVQSGVKEGKTPNEIFKLLWAGDKTIAAFNSLDKSVYPRDYSLILNTIRGITSCD